MIPHEIEVLFEKLEPVYGNRIKPLRIEYHLNPNSRPEIELLLARMLAKSFGNQTPVSLPPNQAVQGAYPLGDVVLGSRKWGPFGLNEDEWIQHVAVFGRSGSGKTNIGFLILRALVDHQKPFRVFDWKRNYRDLLGRQELGGLKVLTVGRDIAPFNFNPLMPPPGDELLGAQAVMELDAFPNSDKTFLIETMLLWLHHKRMRETGREQFKHAVVIEEAHHVLLKRKESKETVVDIILREIRELGESIIFLDQHPSLISVPSLGNSYCTVAMNLKHGNDVSALARAMLLDEEERDLLEKLPVGEALVKLQSRWVMPFHVRFPHFPVEKGKISDDDLRRQKLSYSGEKEEIPAAGGETGEIPVIPGADRIRETKMDLEYGLLFVNESRQDLPLSLCDF